MTGAVAFALLGAAERAATGASIGAVTALFAVILVGFLLMLLRVPVDPASAAAGLVPRFDGAGEPRCWPPASSAPP